MSPAHAHATSLLLSRLAQRSQQVGEVCLHLRCMRTSLVGCGSFLVEVCPGSLKLLHQLAKLPFQPQLLSCHALQRNHVQHAEQQSSSVKM